MQNFVKIKSSRSGEITLLFTNIYVNHALVTNFDVTNMSFNAIRVIYYLRLDSSLCCYICFYILCLIHVKGMKTKKKIMTK